MRETLAIPDRFGQDGQARRRGTRRSRNRPSAERRRASLRSPGALDPTATCCVLAGPPRRVGRARSLLEEFRLVKSRRQHQSHEHQPDQDNEGRGHRAGPSYLEAVHAEDEGDS